MWDYTQPRVAPIPVAASPASGASGDAARVGPHIALKTRRSLRAVHFHPHGAPLMLTAEVRASKQFT